MKDDLEQLLTNLHLGRIKEILDAELAKARKGQITYEDFLAKLLREQYHHRLEKAMATRMQQANIPEKWSLESFPFKRQPGVNQRQIKEFAELDFIPKAENLVFIGPTGVGKTGLATGILLKAIQNGYRGLFIRAQDLFEEMFSSLADQSSRKLLDKYARYPVILIDEMGFLTLRPEQANIFFKLMSERYRRFPTILTTNLDYPAWGDFLGNPQMVEPLLSRMRHQCHTVRIEGPSLRDPQG
jgi:DNA replication protein DnaC